MRENLKISDFRMIIESGLSKLDMDKDTIKLLRIPFSFFLMPVFFFALSQTANINAANAFICFFVLHLFIYPASNGYNSYMDQDETSIGGLEHPPKPTRKLFYTSILFDAIGLTLSLLISFNFFICVALYILASRAYSYKSIRLKKYPLTGFLTVVFFQGAFTFWMVYSAINTGVSEVNSTLLTAMFACSFLIAGVYPLTQVYQHEADYASGDFTISYKLGVTGTFVFTAIMFLIANGLFYFYFNSIQQPGYFIFFQLFLLPVVLHFLQWFIKAYRDKTQASFKNMMRMNFIASICLNLCFILLVIFNLNK